MGLQIALIECLVAFPNISIACIALIDVQILGRWFLARLHDVQEIQDESTINIEELFVNLVSTKAYVSFNLFHQVILLTLLKNLLRAAI